MYPNVHGSVFFSAKSITENYSGFSDSLRDGIYKYPALLPIMSWKDTSSPIAPEELKIEGDLTKRTLTWEIPKTEGKKPVCFVIYRFPSENKIDFNDPQYILTITNNARTKFDDIDTIEKDEVYIYAVTALDRLHNESNAVTINFEAE